MNGNVTTVSIYDTAAGDATPLIGINNVIGSGNDTSKNSNSKQ